MALPSLEAALQQAIQGPDEAPSKAQGLLIWTDRSLERDGQQLIQVKVAAQDIEFQQKARISEMVIKAGRAFFFWRKDRFSSHLDLLELRIGGLTQSLLMASIPGGPAIDASVPAAALQQATNKQKEWLRFWEITREPFVVSDGLNQHYIQLQTPALPIPVKFVGHFAGPISWREDAERSPFLVRWDLSLIVHYTEPDLDRIYELANELIAQ